MNTPISQSLPVSECATQQGDSPMGRTARLLRIIGALAIAGSGLLYMLQGLFHTNTDVRNWVYLALMTALGAGGIFSHRLMQDSKGSRLFFALAVLLIPVQFSQLGGMVLNAVSEEHFALSAFSINAPDTNILLLIGGLSILVAAGLSFAGFSILARAAAKPLCVVFLTMNLLLLLPFRDSVTAAAVLAGLLTLMALLETRLFSRRVIFQTLEGLGVRFILLLPLAIAVSRNAFHFGDALGISAILCAGGLILLYFASHKSVLVASRYVREFLWLFAFILLLPATLTLSHELFGHSQGLLLQLKKPWFSVVYTLPALACCLYFSARATLLTLFYQLAAGAIMCIGIAWALDSGIFIAKFVLWCAALGTLFHGLTHRQKVIFVAGALATTGLGGHLLYSAASNIQVNLWLALAVGGLLLMVLSSICEKHGRKWLHSSRDYWRRFNEWETH